MNMCFFELSKWFLSFSMQSHAESCGNHVKKLFLNRNYMKSRNLDMSNGCGRVQDLSSGCPRVQDLSSGCPGVQDMSCGCPGIQDLSSGCPGRPFLFLLQNILYPFISENNISCLISKIYICLSCLPNLNLFRT